MALFGKLRLVAVMILFSFVALLPGCSMGYTNLHPGENSALYHHFFEDIINNYDEPYWLWIRGTIDGDLNGDGKVEGEIILATIQQGTPKDPGPIEMAFLVVCTSAPSGERVAVARQLLFDSSPIPGAPKPDNDLGIVKDIPFTRCRAQIVQDKISLVETVAVYFWSDPTPSSVWYIGFSFEQGKLVKNMETVIWQDTPGFLLTNLNRSTEDSYLGLQLVFGVAAIPSDIIKELGLSTQEVPLWGHVFSRNEQGYYQQADARFASEYQQLEAAWNQTYLKATLKGLAPEKLAWFEYHMGILNYYLDNHYMATAFLEKARNSAKDPQLIQGIHAAIQMIATQDTANE